MARGLAEKTLARHLDELAQHVERSGARDLDRLYKSARFELEQRLRTLDKGHDRVDYATTRAMIAQIDSVLGLLGADLDRHLKESTTRAAEFGANHGIKEFEVLEKHFRGTQPTLRVREPTILAGLVAGQDSSLLRRRQNQASQIWTLDSIRKVEDALATSSLTNRPFEEVVSRVGSELDLARWRAERIVRTENSFAAGAGKQIAMEEVAARAGRPLMKRLIETFDDRTGDDSFVLHGQTVPVGAPFQWKKKLGSGWVLVEYMHPPNRPNDRAVVIPWDPTWDETAQDRPLSISALRSAAPTRWRKKAGVPIPPGHRPGAPYTSAARNAAKAEAKLIRRELPESKGKAIEIPRPGIQPPAPPPPPPPEKSDGTRYSNDRQDWWPMAYRAAPAASKPFLPTRPFDHRAYDIAATNLYRHRVGKRADAAARQLREEISQLLGEYRLANARIERSDKIAKLRVRKGRNALSHDATNFGGEIEIADVVLMTKPRHEVARILIHEHVHDGTDVRYVKPNARGERAYRRHGAIIEEVATETIAQKIAADRFGDDWSRISYRNEVDGIASEIARIECDPSQLQRARETIARASFGFKSKVRDFDSDAPGDPTDRALDLFMEALAEETGRTVAELQTVRDEILRMGKEQRWDF